MGDYFFEYKLLPRSGDDLVAGDDADCLPVETGDELCGDDTDNDYNGFADCEDFSCADAAVACPTTETSVADIQGGTVAVDTDVSLTGVTVTGVSFDRRQLWVQDDAQAAENSGIFVFRGFNAEPLPATVVIGATLDVQGTVTEFACSDDLCADATLTEITSATVDLDSVAEGTPPTALSGIDLAVVASDPDGEPYEGVLVTLQNVEVTVAPNQFGVFFVGDGTTELMVDNDIFEHEATLNECFATLTGIMHRNTFDGPINILPRSAADVVTGTDCE